MIFRVLLAVLFFGAFGASAVELSSSVGKLNIGPELEILLDPDEAFSISDVSSGDQSDAFEQPNQSSINLGLVEGAVWVRFRLTYNGTEPLRRDVELTNRFIQNVQIYTALEEGFQVTDLDGKPFGARPFTNRSFLVPTVFPPGTDVVNYLRIRSEAPLRFSVIVWDPDFHGEEEFVSLITLGMIVGGLILLAGYHLVLLISLKDRSYFYMGMFLVFAASWQAHIGGIAFWQLWPERPGMVLPMTLISAGMMMAFSVLCTRRYVSSKTQAATWDKVLLGLFVVCVFLCLLAVISVRTAMMMVFLVTLLWPTISLGASYFVWKKGTVVSVRYLVAGWGVLLVATIGDLLVNLAVLPGNFYTDWMPEIGFCVAVAVFSVGLASRTKVIVDSGAVKLREEREQLEGILPVCAFCKNIRNDAEEWFPLEKYIEDRAEVEFSNTYCPECARKQADSPS